MLKEVSCSCTSNHGITVLLSFRVAEKSTILYYRRMDTREIATSKGKHDA